MTENPRRLELDCGIRRERIATWLDDELQLEPAGARWVFSNSESACFIELTPLENRVIAAFNLERTLLVAEGDADAVAAFNRLFTLRFMSAGG